MKPITLSPQMLGRLCRSLSLLLHSGISQADAFYLLAKEESAPLSEILTALGEGLDGGLPLSLALAPYACFPKHMVGMLRIGEHTGKTEEALNYLAEYYDARYRAQKLLRNALAYPSMILLCMLLVIGVLLVKVLPVFDNVYVSLGSRLTGIAAGLLQLGQWLQGLLPVLLGFGILLALLVLLYSLCLPVRKAMTNIFQKQFGDRGILRRFNNARFAQALSMGLGSGLTLEESLDLAQQLLEDTPDAQARCNRCAKLIEEGIPLAEALTETRLLPAAAGRMLSVGIRSGSSDLVMQTIARQLDEEAADALETAVARVEPAMVLVVSLLVGMILLSVMLPLMNILSAIG